MLIRKFALLCGDCLVYLHKFNMYGDYLNMWLLHNTKTMQIYKFTHNPVLLLFVHQLDRVTGRSIANRLINVIVTRWTKAPNFTNTVYVRIIQNVYDCRRQGEFQVKLINSCWCFKSQHYFLKPLLSDG